MSSNERVISPQVFIDAAEYYGFTYEFAERKIDAYLDTRGDDAKVDQFIAWLEIKRHEESA